ncbi:MAG: hypothetical protein ACTTHI_03105 [Prevotella sp.]
MKIKTIIGAALLSLTACTSSPFDNGNGTNSFLKRDAAEVTINKKEQTANIVFDDDQKASVKLPAQHPWLTGTETLYRAIVTYREKDQVKSILGFIPMMLLQPVTQTTEEVKSDPVLYVASSFAKNKKYLNIQLTVPMRVESAKNKPINIAIVEKKHTMATKTNTHYIWTVVFSNKETTNNVTEPALLSIPTSQLVKGDSLTLKIQNGIRLDELKGVMQ